MEIFYGGLSKSSHMLLDFSANGALVAKTFDEAVEILDRITKNNSQWAVDYSMSRQLMIHQKVAGVVENDQIFPLKVQMQAVQMMLKKVNMHQSRKPTSRHATIISSIAQAESTTTNFCIACGDFHIIDYCP